MFVLVSGPLSGNFEIGLEYNFLEKNFYARWLEIEEKTCGLSCSVIKHELDENMQISQVKKQNGKSEKLLASTRPLSAFNQHIYKLHLCSQLPPNLVSFPNPLAPEAENLSSPNLCLLLALFGGHWWPQL